MYAIARRVARRHVNAYGGVGQWRPWVPGEPLWHGSPLSFDAPKATGSPKVLWLTDDRDSAVRYASKHYVRSDTAYVWEIHLKPGARIVDMRDLSNPVVRSLKDSVSEIRQHTWGPISDEDWPSFADFGLIEGYSWVRPFLRSRRVDGVWVDDTVDGTRGHRSIALLNTGAIASAVRYEHPRA